VKPADNDVLILDGACGTNIQAMDLPASAWDGKEGCTEVLNLSAPDAVFELHRSFVEAGARVLETNTFGATRIVLGEYGLADKVAEINAAAVELARRAIGGAAGRLVAGSIGPTTKLPSLGHISRDELFDAFTEQVSALVEAGVDMLIVETCQDLLQLKTALVSCFEVLERADRDVPVMASVTVERTGTMLVGSDIAAAVATIGPFPIFSLGLNCATGPEAMESHIRFLHHNWPGRISCIPNQGLPQVVDGGTVYPLAPAEYAARMRAFVEEYGVSVVGGCCGTTPEHIRQLVAALDGVIPPARSDVRATPSVSSLYQASELRQDIPPVIIGERTNANGSKKFRELLLADDYPGCLQIALGQEAGGAHLIDLCAAYAGRDETADMTELVTLFSRSVKIPVVIDSTTPDCIEACLKLYPGRCIVNSINLEDGGTYMRRVCALLKKYGGAAVALTINEDGMAMTADEKIATARRIHDMAVGEFDLRPGDLLFDPLTFTIGAGDENLRDAAVQTLDAIRRIKQELLGVGTVLGVSNISFGLSRASRRVLNSVFLHEAVEAGLDAAIVDAGKILPLARIGEDDREICLDLLYDRVRDEEKTPLMLFIEHFQDAAASDDEHEDEGGAKRAEQVLREQVVSGDKEGLEDQLAILLQRFAPVAVINEILVPAMRHVGELFGRGEILLPFVLQSAEVMKKAVAFLEPLMEKADTDSATKVLLATVQGDVHDIGKNLVDIILSNNGYRVFNLGIKVPAETVIEKAREYDVDVVGLSGLLVKSAIVMQESMHQYASAGLGVPILLGGAALTSKFVAESCVPNYDRPVVYCADAFAGLKAVRELEEGRLVATTYEPANETGRMKPGVKDADIVRDNPVPEPPFLGCRHVHDVDPAGVFPFVNVQALFRGRWGYRRAKMSADEYAELIRTKVEPMYEDLKREALEGGLVRPKAAYGYYRCFSRGDVVVVEDRDALREFAFPRQTEPPHLCIADFFKSEKEGGDVAAFFVVTIGEEIGRRTHELFEGDCYHDYLMLHGFSVEVTDALAEYWHGVMRAEMGIAGAEPDQPSGYVTQAYQGSRYGFGYPACPDLGAHEPVFAMLSPGEIGVTLTENMEMVPEQTTSAIIVHHPQAKYFAV